MRKHEKILRVVALRKRNGGVTETNIKCSASPESKVNSEEAAISAGSIPFFPALASPPQISKVKVSRRITSSLPPEQGLAKKVRFTRESSKSTSMIARTRVLLIFDLKLLVIERG